MSRSSVIVAVNALMLKRLRRRNQRLLPPAGFIEPSQNYRLTSTVRGARVVPSYPNASKEILACVRPLDSPSRPPP